MKKFERFRNYNFRSFSVVIALLFLTIAAYGIYILWMGFYWDDWPWIFFSNVIGPQSLIGIELHRPLSGLFLWFGAELLGETPLYWQIFALLLRFLSGLAFWWVIVSIWPRRIERATWITFVFLLYPGFTHQFVAVNSSRHLFALLVFFISLGLMVWSIRKQKWYWLLTILSLLLSVIGTLTSEYFYGLELLRPVVIWLVLDFGYKVQLDRLRTLLKYWIPYFVFLIVVFFWRYLVSQKVNYRIAPIDTFFATPIETLVESVRKVVIDLFLVTLAAWSKIFAFPSPEEVGVRVTFYYWLIVLVSVFLVFIYFIKFRRDDYNRSWGKEAIFLGMISLVIAFLPFWVTDIDIKLVFPADRTTLPMIFGVSILLIGLLDLLIRPRLVKVILLSILVGLGIGYQFQTALSFRIDWIHQVSFLRQLSWRIPGLEEGTALLSVELPTRSTDNSLTAPINWIYADDIDDTSLPYHLLFLDLRLGTSLPALTEGLPLTYNFRTLRFEGSLDNALVVYYKDSECLRIIHPDYDSYNPHIPELIADARPFSNLKQVVIKKDEDVSLPSHVFGIEPEPGWCYFFQKADLARQWGDWQQVVAYGEAAFNSNETPNNASELVPFIQGYAFTGKWGKAVKSTKEASRIDPFMKPMLCSIWEDIAINTEPTTEQDNALQSIREIVNCPELY